MREALASYLLFLAETLTVAGAVVAAAGLIAALRRGAKTGSGSLEITHLNDRLGETAGQLDAVLLEGKMLRKARRSRRAAQRERRNQADAGRVFVLDFDGDLTATGVAALREEITALLQACRAGDEVVLRLESTGGTVHGYGLAAAQLQRLRDRGLTLTVAVDKVAASGGYLMACVASRILAAPFAIIGSIGVVAQLPNFHRLLQQNHIDYELHTAGEFKRTLTLFGENTEAAREKFRGELEEAHALFKLFLGEHRPQLPLSEVATGEHWFGRRALELKLIDELCTSDDYLLRRAAQADIYELSYIVPRHWSRQLMDGFARLRGSGSAALSTLPGPML